MPPRSKKLTKSHEKKKPSRSFDYSLDYSSLDLRASPHLYRVGRGEQGVLMVEPYKTEILPHWRFKDPATALKSSRAILKLFRSYQRAGDFVGMDMARKFLQMGYTRARRYANHAGGRKYDENGRVLPFTPDAVKAKAAALFYEQWKAVEADADYAARKVAHKLKFG